MNAHRWVLVACVCSAFAVANSFAQEPAAEKKADKRPQMVELVEGKLLLPVPGEWEKVEPRTRIIAHEFSVPPEEKPEEETDERDETPGRLTIMSAGGGVKANVARWVGQFKTSDGKPLGDDEKKVEEKQVGPLTVHLVDLAGTFRDQPRGPFGPSVERPDYRMLAAIIPTEKGGVWFIKFYGPSKTIAAQAENFAKMIEGIEWRGAEAPLINHGDTEESKIAE